MSSCRPGGKLRENTYQREARLQGQVVSHFAGAERKEECWPEPTGTLLMQQLKGLWGTAASNSKANATGRGITCGCRRQCLCAAQECGVHAFSAAWTPYVVKPLLRQKFRPAGVCPVASGGWLMPAAPCDCCEWLGCCCAGVSCREAAIAAASIASSSSAACMSHQNK